MITYTKEDLELLMFEADSRLLSLKKEYNRQHDAMKLFIIQDEIRCIELFKDCIYRLYYLN